MTERSRVGWAGGMALRVLCLALVVAACAPAARGPSAAGAGAQPAAGSAPVAASAGGGQAAPAGSGPRRFAIELVSPITNHNPYSQSGGEIPIAWGSVFQGLVRFNSEQRTYEPLVAERWEVPEPTRWRFYIREARFSDGSPLTAADVQHSIVERALNDPDSTRRSSISTVQDAVVVDERTVDVLTKVPDATLLQQLGTIPMTSKALYDRVGKQAADRAPVSAGPYTLHELVPDQRMVLRKHPHYWGDVASAPDEVLIRWIKESMVGMTALLSGEVDMSAPLPPNLIPQLTGNVRPRQRSEERRVGKEWRSRWSP